MTQWLSLVKESGGRVIMARILRLDLEQDSLFYANCINCDERLKIEELTEIDTCQECYKDVLFYLPDWVADDIREGK